ncbi:3-O-alpha-D-glucosyl-L-rhamnose phosphorylase [Lachnoclostridium phytofermentans]|uniref:3-O-alpha-D-glucosyl-L-rhamnose phosphorylase n=1 Tax=Lachnoclostridium phytofermentans (strain ATCC 700394 / DSM 18823 / ISDg) TaxID=357809 RepID=3OAGR_LACP7|nr:3-O-alpha-D-glucosyl-L-rhamnose phosphorylase [Lachnoclostridium phytofermentans]A9KM56.1 RecName: Full=3-O-alpha-D-glucosyl-L-rhamnose phosphorylase; AltName: Full=3-O-alpha-D-glucopyranosyl-L-rhamnopyranose:phosphate beta-D-glucosyltransferase [Lachnoclostridium phytofermentans ISDg]ABX41399.1 Kojibiose phosphorylase [Lachnoclostridium phytofermentans ISDg]
MLIHEDNRYIVEKEYNLVTEPQNASLFTTGNGYMGVRGSLEEFGSTRIQGSFIRGFVDEIIEVIEPFCDNEYMKKYYFDEEKLKKFDKQISCINLVDFLLIRFRIGDEIFYPWEGEILSWERRLDTSQSIFQRSVTWKDKMGNITVFEFERFASYDEEHRYCMRAMAKPQNHFLPVEIISGIDTDVRTGGQRVLQFINNQILNNGLISCFQSGKRYGITCKIAVKNSFFMDGKLQHSIGEQQENLLLNKALMPGGGREYCVEKTIYLTTDRDCDPLFDTIDTVLLDVGTYDAYKEAHIREWSQFFSNFDIKILGDDRKDAQLRFATYHAVITGDRNNSIHSLSAKGLTGERYNQFVWWDCEIYQLPIFIHAFPEVAKHALIYRYDRLEEARENAKLEGCKGARYPFVSSLEGKEHVWIYARHPFLQVHITADIGFGIINYFINTLDYEFMELYGFEMLYEICRYWVSKVILKDGTYQLLGVTGTDEHHPYVDNDAYTNYIVQYVLQETILLDSQYSSTKVRDKIGITVNELKDIEQVSRLLYLPLEKSGLIPQFDGYFDLSRDLEVDGSGTGKNFQMKQAGLYHKSQVIKQPDVMLLFSYLNFEIKNSRYEENWDYYEKMCESSSSLTFPVHAICSADANRMLSFLNYFNETVNIDLLDIHHCAWQGVHAGCLSGAWYAIFRGLMGIVTRIDCIQINPKLIPFWQGVELSFIYQTKKIKATLNGNVFTLGSEDKKEISVYFQGKRYAFVDRLEVSF